MINCLSQHKGKGKTVKKLFVYRLNPRGETEIYCEVVIPHPIEVLEKEMAKYYTQSFPLNASTTVKSSLEILQSCHRVVLIVRFHRLKWAKQKKLSLLHFQSDHLTFEAKF